MLSLLILLILGGKAHAFSPTIQDLEAFAHGHIWRSLFNGTSASDPRFFLHPQGKQNPRLELQKTIELLKSTVPVGHTQFRPVCTFPARYQRLAERWPELKSRIDKIECPDLLKWKKTIDAQSISMLYVGPYLNNPASMFGHTLLRFKRKSGEWLNDYNLAFLATTDPNDSPAMYTIKGIAGGYTGYYHLDPYYINANRYNNSERRDIWEYEIPLSPEELDFFMNHLWEVSLNTGFQYYFTSENCSYFLATIFSATHERFKDFPKTFLLHPIEITKYFAQTNSYTFRPSVRKKILHRYALLSGEQNKTRREIERTKTIPQGFTDTQVLDVLIESEKTRNYKRLKFTTAENPYLNELLKTRAVIPQASPPDNIQTRVNPIEIHDPMRLSLGGSTDQLRSRFSLGYHGVRDSEQGLSQWSFVDYLGLETQTRRNKTTINEVLLIDIISLAPMMWDFPEFSWQLKSVFETQCWTCEGEMKQTLQAGLGLSWHFKRFVVWNFLSLDNGIDRRSIKLTPQYQLAGKWLLSKMFSLHLAHDVGLVQEKAEHRTKGSLSYHHKQNHYLSVELRETPVQEEAVVMGTVHF